MWLLYVSCAWVAGIFLGSKLSLPWVALLIGLVPLAFIAFFPRNRKTLTVASLCLLAVLGGALRFTSNLPRMDEHSLCFYNGKGVVELQGVVSEQPDIRDRYCLLTFSASEITANGIRRDVSGTALIRVPRYPVYDYGDVLRVTGELETPAQSGDFDYKAYLANRGIYSVSYYPAVELLTRWHGIQPLHWIYWLRERLSASLAAALPEPQASLAQGILLGLRASIPDSLSQAFARTGTAHILAISGANLTIIIAMLLSLGILIFGRQHSIHIWLALVLTWLYALLTGMHPPVTRAAIMGSLFLIAQYLGRQGNGIIALAFAAAVMVGMQPGLLWTTSFQLSFLSMAGLILLYPYFQAWGTRGIARAFGDRQTLAALCNVITDAFAASLASTVAIAPLIAYNFGIVSLVGVPATFLSLPSLPLIIVTSALVAFAGLFASLAAQALGWLAWLFISYFIFLVRGFDSLPYSSLNVADIPAWCVLGYYGLLLSVLALVKRRRELTDLPTRLTSALKRTVEHVPKPRLGFSLKWFVLPLLTVAILIWSIALTMPDGKLHVSFLDVGQGDAILIRLPNGQDVLIDGGPSSQRINLELSEKLPFWDRTIDLAICTQPQGDHVTGLIEILQRYRVKQVLDPGVPYDSPIYQEWRKVIGHKGIKYTVAHAGQEIDLGNGIKLEILNPPQSLWKGTSDDVDNNGMVMRLSWNQISFLFTADIREEIEFELIGQRANLKSTVLKVAHHGSKTSTSVPFVAAVDPEVAVICVGKGNPYGHPSREVLDRLIARLGEDNVYRTDEDGTIEFITDGERLWVRTDRQGVLS